MVFIMGSVQISTILVIVFVFGWVAPEVAPHQKMSVCSEDLNFLQCIDALSCCNKLLSLISQSGLNKTFTKGVNMSVFAPTDKAVSALPETVTKDAKLVESVLKFHLAMTDEVENAKDEDLIRTHLAETFIRVNYYGNNLANVTNITTVNGARILSPNEQSHNGDVYVIDKVMYPLPTGNIYDVIANDDGFSLLILLLSQANLLETIQGGTYTLLAPTDDAFSNLPDGAIVKLLEDIPKLKEVLLGHVIDGSYYSSGLIVDRKVRTLSNTELKTDSGKIMFEGGEAEIIGRDVSTTNGVVQIINTVIFDNKMLFELV